VHTIKSCDVLNLTACIMETITLGVKLLLFGDKGGSIPFAC
jgi:hypothetical protein